MEDNISTPLKRQREEEGENLLQQEEGEYLKRQKSYKDIITLLEEEEDHEPTEDVSSLISTLQEELSSGSGSDSVSESDPDPEKVGSLGSVSGSGGEEERGGEGENVMRHLLEASDDELGLPSSTDGFDSSAGVHVDGVDLFGESLWEFEDHEAANYYNLLQSEIFM